MVVWGVYECDDIRMIQEFSSAVKNREPDTYFDLDNTHIDDNNVYGSHRLYRAYAEHEHEHEHEHEECTEARSIAALFMAREKIANA